MQPFFQRDVPSILIEKSDQFLFKTFDKPSPGHPTSKYSCGLHAGSKGLDRGSQGLHGGHKDLMGSHKDPMGTRRGSHRLNVGDYSDPNGGVT